MKQPYLSTTRAPPPSMLIGAQGGGWARWHVPLPTFLRTERGRLHSVGTSSYLFVLIVGAFFGFVFPARISPT